MLSLALLALLPVSTAHFVLTWPPNRGFDDAKAINFPCGGFDSVKTPRTDFPITGGPIQLDMHHTQTNVEVLLSIGSDPGRNYNIVLRRTFAQEGLGNFCAGEVSIPAGLNITSGTLATIQVVSNGDPDGGLYQASCILPASAVQKTNISNSALM
jgi:hypothetical protein